MSRQSPLGFAFSIVLEIAAVVAVVSFLPRVDLRPTAAAGVNDGRAAGARSPTVDPAISRVSWTASDRMDTQPAARESSYYERPTARPASGSRPGQLPAPPEAPPLIELDPARSQYVEQRLDRASQQLVNSVGSYVTQAAGNLANYQPRTVAPPSYASNQTTTTYFPATLPPPAPTSQPTLAPPPASTPQRPTAGSFATQPRPWLRY
jgi:hypothetical protein